MAGNYYDWHYRAVSIAFFEMHSFLLWAFSPWHWFDFRPDVRVSLHFDRLSRTARAEQVSQASPFKAFTRRHLLHDEFTGGGFTAVPGIS